MLLVHNILNWSKHCFLPLCHFWIIIFFTLKVKSSDRTKNLVVSKGDEDVSTYCISWEADTKSKYVMYSLIKSRSALSSTVNSLKDGHLWDRQ